MLVYHARIKEISSGRSNRRFSKGVGQTFSIGGVGAIANSYGNL